MKNSFVTVVFIAAIAVAQAAAGQAERGRGEVFQKTPPPRVELDLPADSEGEPQPRQAPDTSEGADKPSEPVPEDAFLRQVNREVDRLESGAGTPGTADTAGTPGTAAASQETRPGTGFIYYLKVVSSLCLVIALILIVGYLARRLGKRTPLLAGAELGSVLGRMQLARGASLHFVRTGGRVLVVGVTATHTSLVAEFDDSAFLEGGEGRLPGEERSGLGSFRAQLQSSSESMGPTASENAGEKVEEDEIDSLRGDIQRLQKHLRRESREPRE